MCFYPGRSYQVYTTSLIAYQGWIKRLKNAMRMIVHKNVDRPKLCFTQVKQLRNAIHDPKINLAGNGDTPPENESRERVIQLMSSFGLYWATCFRP